VAGQIRIIDVKIEVRQPPFASFLIPVPVVAVDKGTLEVVARFDIQVTPEPGYDKPVWLDVINASGGYEFSVNPIPVGGGASLLTIHCEGFQVGDSWLSVAAMEDQPVLGEEGDA
jgi:hypothetical protein